jgi:predicted nucleic acid-binding protein
VKILFDTNVVLDFLLDREPFASAAADLFSAVERRVLAGVLGATTVTTLAYLAVKAVGHKLARQQIAALLTLFEIAPVTSFGAPSRAAFRASRTRCW